MNAGDLAQGDRKAATSAAGRRVPLAVKLLYSGFLCIMAPSYWAVYGPTNFLFLCDVAAMMTLVAVWSERPIWASMPCVGILTTQALWTADFAAGLLGLTEPGLTAYMFSPAIPLAIRALSLYHLWLPLLLLWLVYRLGYDRRAFAAWAIVALNVMLLCYYVAPAPPAPPENPNLPVNINYVFGLSDRAPQDWMPPPLYLVAAMATLLVVLVLPAHLLLLRLMPPQRQGSDS